MPWMPQEIMALFWMDGVATSAGMLTMASMAVMKALGLEPNVLIVIGCCIAACTAAAIVISIVRKRSK